MRFQKFGFLLLSVATSILAQTLVTIPAGCFRMGSPEGNSNEVPVHTTCVKEFQIDATEVTQSQFQTIMNVNPETLTPCASIEMNDFLWNNQNIISKTFLGPQKPAICILWDEARQYCEKVGKRLPSEAEWEYAARAGSTSFYFWGQDSKDACLYGNVADQSLTCDDECMSYRIKCHDGFGVSVAPVETFRPNAWGLYDMSGNAEEWVNDPMDTASNYNEQPSVSASDHVSRGGSWLHYSRGFSSSYRSPGLRNKRSTTQGFRCAK